MKRRMTVALQLLWGIYGILTGLNLLLLFRVKPLLLPGAASIAWIAALVGELLLLLCTYLHFPGSHSLACHIRQQKAQAFDGRPVPDTSPC